jgi:hypothetical protein
MSDESKTIPPLIEFPNGMWLDPGDIIGIRPANAAEATSHFPGFRDRIIVDWGNKQVRNSAVVEYFDTFYEAKQAARDLAARVNKAREATRS